MSQVVNTVRNGPFWLDTVIFITYEEHGGYYDHVAPPKARQVGARTPDGISPGQCTDLSDLPLSLQPGGGAQCAQNPFSIIGTSVKDAETLCPALAANPTGEYPEECASFDQLGFRVPLMTVSPFAKAHYVSHAVGDHTSLLAFIEKRFLSLDDPEERLHLTSRDQHANTLEDMFDFERSPSLNTAVGQASPPASDCTPH
ncbi:MAG TPA: alkaline phosphatase family protein [Candidatus Acidoferrum sp.]